MPNALAVTAIAVVTLLTVTLGARGIRIARTPADFFVASREVPSGLNAAAISGEYLSAASFLGIAGLVFMQGLGALWYAVGYLAGYLVLLLLVAAPLRRFGAYTIPDFASGRLESLTLARTTTVLVLIIGWFYLIPQLTGAGITIQFVLGTPYWVGVVILGVVVSSNIAMGGMKGVTFVQSFQYWLKLCAIAIPALVLFGVAGLGSTRNLSPDRDAIFSHRTIVHVADDISFISSRPTVVTVSGVLDKHRILHRPVRLAAGQHQADAGTDLSFSAGTPVPIRVGLVPAHSPSWDSPFVTAGTDGAHPLVATYGLIIATFFGAIGLPHILVRFYTNHSGPSARRTTLIVLVLLSGFYVFPALLGVLSRLRAPQLYLTGNTNSVVLALPTLLLSGKTGELLVALVAAGAFAAFLSTSSGLLISVAGALSHDILNGSTRAFRLCALIAGGVAIAVALPLNHYSLTVLVGWAFAIAASSFCPLIVLGIWWRNLTWIGAMAGVVAGGGGCCAAIAATMLGAATNGWGAVLLGQPAIWTVPLAFCSMIVISLLTSQALPGSVDQVLQRMHLPEPLMEHRYQSEPPPVQERARGPSDRKHEP
jgi:Na+(H+)/acetate symporter ActP